MGLLNRELIQQLLENNLNSAVFWADFALEKENVRVDSQGKLALTPHPKAFGSKMENPYIKTDFSESQIEMITPVFDSVEKTHDFLNTLHDIVTLQLNDEYLWPSSNPPVLPDEDEIPIANMNDVMADEYRAQLAKKYGRKKQLFSGIHYNFSFNIEFLRKWYERTNQEKSFKEFKDSIYLKVARNTLKYRWFLNYFTGASPVFHETFLKECVEAGDLISQEGYVIGKMNSLRNSEYGYRNHKPFYISFDKTEEYLHDIGALIHEKELLNEKEFYSPVRLKPAGGKKYAQTLLDQGIAYLELRMIDLNPLEKIGISKEMMRFIHLFLVYTLVKVDESYDQEEQRFAAINSDNLTKKGIQEILSTKNGSSRTMQDVALEVISDMEEMLSLLIPGNEEFCTVLENVKEKILNKSTVYAEQIKAEIKQSSYILYHLNKAREYFAVSQQSGYQFTGLDDLELSTQLLLKAAVKRGIEFDIIDREENFILLKKGNLLEYVKQATKTSLDTYITVLIMENKLVTKHVLKEQGIRVPNGRSYLDMSKALSDYEHHQNEAIVIKPKSTNFGLGITIFKDAFSKEDYHAAIDMAFQYDNTILLEEFISGKEYRFLVMGEEVTGILHRVPANVEGDGIHTIEELVKEKNKDSLRGKGYKTPLERINLGDSEKMFLKNQGKKITDIPAAGEVVFLRENSNISTGGDSIDYTDEIPESYKKIAIKAAKSANAVFCGVDMMINNTKEAATDDNYAIIEINFNPAIHIHCYPYKGKNRKADEKILDLLFGPIGNVL